MNTATLVWSCRPLKPAYEPSPATRLINSIIKDKFVNNKSTRVVIRNNKYIYHPTDEYKQFVVRFRKIK